MKTTLLFVLILVLLFLTLATLLISYICFRIAFYASRKEPANPEEYSIPEGEIYEPFRDQMITWMKETRSLPHQEFEITSLEGFDAKELVEEILNNNDKLQIVVDLVNQVTELQLVNKVAYNAAIGYVSNIDLVVDAGTDVTQAVKDLSKVDWSEDINIYVEALVEALNYGTPLFVGLFGFMFDKFIKAKTKEKLDAVGENLAIEANAVVLLTTK